MYFRMILVGLKQKTQFGVSHAESRPLTEQNRHIANHVKIQSVRQSAKPNFETMTAIDKFSE